MSAGVPQIGIRRQLGSVIAAEAIASCGDDHVDIDMEQGMRGRREH
jgi:2-keto-3-deoxy-L-rhamnonate aldolase RhmA